MRLFIPILLVSFLICFNVSAQPDSYNEKVKILLKSSGGEETFKVAIKSIINQTKTIRNDIPSELWDDLETEFLNTSIDDLVKLLSPIYQKHLSTEDLDNIISFYKTPSGKKFAAKTPLITQESIQAGQQWGHK